MSKLRKPANGQANHLQLPTDLTWTSLFSDTSRLEFVSISGCPSARAHRDGSVMSCCSRPAGICARQVTGN